MHKLTASNLVSLIGQLDKTVAYNYVNPSTPTHIKILSIDGPEGPISILRWNPNKGETHRSVRPVSISTEMIWRVANAISPSHPFNIDRILGASFNTRSALEALLAHTPVFYFCYPGRIETIAGNSEVKRGHKHLLWVPGTPHPLGQLCIMETNQVISEIPSTEIVYDALVFPDNYEIDEAVDFEQQRRHSQIQIALYLIGKQLNYRTWIAQNDKGIMYQDRQLAEHEGIIASLRDERLLQAHEDAARAALLIDCIWFKNGRLMPAVLEVEHSTGVTSGLTRMKKFQDAFIRLEDVRYVIVAPEEIRDKVVREANHDHFRSLNTRFFPYGAVEELYGLCSRRKIKGVTEEFLDCYMERVVV